MIFFFNHMYISIEVQISIVEHAQRLGGPQAADSARGFALGRVGGPRAP